VQGGAGLQAQVQAESAREDARRSTALQPGEERQQFAKRLIAGMVDDFNVNKCKFFLNQTRVFKVFNLKMLIDFEFHQGCHRHLNG